MTEKADYDIATIEGKKTECHQKVIVYVQHYLTSVGMTYFQEEWFPWVYSIISKQPGFIKISHHIKGSCAYLSLHFENATTFETWLSHPIHDSLVDALDPYRDRNYWQAVRTNDEHIEPSQLTWTKVTAPHRVVT